MEPLKELEKSIFEYRKNYNLTQLLDDGQRAPLVDHLVIHHSAGSEYENVGELFIADIFSDVGKKRGYDPIKKAHSNHTHPYRNKESFAMAHFALHKYNLDGNHYGWRLVPLILEWDRNVCWHAGNWEINTRSIGIEICGDYRKKYVEDGALQLIADYFRPEYKRVKKAGGIYHVMPHQWVSLGHTECPGKIIEQIPALRNLIFQWDKLDTKE